ncbi:formylglycine-generating enzyme family protein [Sphingomonas sp. AP4-R1]|uniref:formylglycine-generating enzyme family protein n=1 Tax=Sphingomonas sp. AP4-R1 TaxID=2735134 RepID=UPI001493BDC8|nr:formylglycine-generating enzyme family protein [Sphingomonas sp. AP4-R1]QJU60053.1 formylglycine-generating enzyme family protein [Sphingomonas sp. AP4-R1]
MLPAGRFVMGSPATEQGRKDDESPPTQIEVRSFAMGQTDVTRRQWAAFVADTHRPDGIGCAYSGLSKGEAGTASWRHLGFAQRDDDPVVCVSWSEAQAYVDWLSRKMGRPYRLPTEAEWEYAARAGSVTAYPWGDEPSHDFANYGADACCTGATGGRDVWVNTSPVKSFAPNAFGLYDMIGNAWQWTQDCYTASLAGRPKDASAVDSAECKFRVARGGTWGDTPALIRSASRNYAPPPNLVVTEYRSAGFGLRIVSSDVAPRSGSAKQ